MPQGYELVLRRGQDLGAAMRVVAELEAPEVDRLWVRGEGLDAISLAASVATSSSLPIGVVVPLDRSPSVLARDLTTLTHLCPAGLVVALRPEASEQPRLGEYLGVLRAMFSAEDTTLELGESRLEGTPNRPLPATPGGPQLWVDRRAGAHGEPAADGELGEGSLVELAS